MQVQVVVIIDVDALNRSGVLGTNGAVGIRHGMPLTLVNSPSVARIEEDLVSKGWARAGTSSWG